MVVRGGGDHRIPRPGNVGAGRQNLSDKIFESATGSGLKSVQQQFVPWQRNEVASRVITTLLEHALNVVARDPSCHG